MIEESTLKSNFIGRDGFRWWIGQIAPTESAPQQVDGEGWAVRYKVRILGYHSADSSELPNENLPWAGVLLPPNAGTGGGGFAQSTRINQGDVVVGFFLDGDNAQIPMIMGSFGKTQFVSSSGYTAPFVPFTGYTTNIKSPETKSNRESTGQSTEDQKQPRNLKPDNISTINENNEGKGKAVEYPASEATGQVITFADTCEDNFATQVSGILGNLINVIGESTDFLSDVQNAVKKIQFISNQFVGTLFRSLYEELIPILKQGLDILYKTVYAKVLAATGSPIAAHAAGVAAQESMVGPVKAVQDAIACVSAKIIRGLGDTIKDLIEKSLLEVVNFGVCTAEQFVGSLLNDVIDEIDSGLESVLDGISKILSPLGFNLVNFLRSSVDVIKSVQDFFSCNQTGDKCAGVKEWTIGYGPKNKANVNDILNKVLENANVSNALASTTTLTSPYSKPNCAEPTSCGAPKVSFFGGDGSGGAGRVLLGGIVDNTNGLGEVTSSVARTGSIIGVEITDPGSGYYYAPPMVSFDDPCQLGYGAVGRAIVDFNSSSPTYGKITGVYIISEGENYPVGDDGEIDNGVDDTIILYPGRNYSPGDTAVDENGVEYNLSIDVENGGKIVSASPISVSPINKVKVDTLPNIVVNTATGSGALIKPLIKPFTSEQQGEVISVIDCV